MYSALVRSTIIETFLTKKHSFPPQMSSLCAEWATDDVLFYSTQETLRCLRVFRLHLSDSGVQNTLVYEEKDPEYVSNCWWRVLLARIDVFSLARSSGSLWRSVVPETRGWWPLTAAVRSALRCGLLRARLRSHSPPSSSPVSLDCFTTWSTRTTTCSSWLTLEQTRSIR